MNCTTFEIWIQETSSQRERVLPADAAGHLAECALCRSRLAAESQLDVAIRAWQRAPLAVPPTERIVTAVLAERALSQPQSSRLPKSSKTSEVYRRESRFEHGSSRLVWTTVACALAVLLAVSWGLRTDRLTDELAQRSSTGPNRAALVPVSDSVVALWTDVQRTSQSVAQDTVRSLAVPPLQELSPFPASRVSHAVDPATQTGQDAARLAAPTWRPFSEPISERVNTAFSFLGDVLPAASPGAAG